MELLGKHCPGCLWNRMNFCALICALGLFFWKAFFNFGKIRCSYCNKGGAWGLSPKHVSIAALCYLGFNPPGKKKARVICILVDLLIYSYV